MGRLRLIDYILIGSRTQCTEGGSTDLLNLGSDHRAVYAKIVFKVSSRCKESWKIRNCDWSSTDVNALREYTESMEVWASHRSAANFDEIETAISSASGQHLQAEKTKVMSPWNSETVRRAKLARDREKDPARRKALQWSWRRILRKETRVQRSIEIGCNIACSCGAEQPSKAALRWGVCTGVG